MTSFAYLTELLRRTYQLSKLSTIQTHTLADQTRYTHVWSSNAIKGNQLTRYDVSSLLQTGRSPFLFIQQLIQLTNSMLSKSHKHHPSNQVDNNELNGIAH